MSHVMVDDYGRFVGKKSERLVVSQKGKVIEEVPFRDLKEVTIASSGVSISTDALAGCIEFGVTVNFLTSGGKPYAIVMSPELNGTVITRREQLKAYDDHRGVHLAKCFVKGKVSNQASLVKYLAKHRRDKDIYGDLMDRAASISSLEKDADLVAGDTVDECRLKLMNIEGRAAAIYWKVIGDLAMGEGFEGREHRGAIDPFNATLNYGYGILYNQVWGAVVLAGLEPFGGFLHVDRPGKPSLVLDLVEEFRAPTVDRAAVVKLIRGWRPEYDAEERLTLESRREIATAVLERLDTRERYAGKKHKMNAVIVSQARKVASYLRGEGPYRPYRATW